MSQCQREGCEAEAVCALGLHVPAKGWPIDLHVPLKIILGVEMCQKHFDETVASAWIADEKMKELFRIQARMTGSDIPPDFDRVYKSKIELDSKEYRTMKDGR